MRKSNVRRRDFGLYVRKPAQVKLALAVTDCFYRIVSVMAIGSLKRPLLSWAWAKTV
jgi:hypothetical protein